MSEAPAKVILFGEHAVVYGEPGIAIPISALKTSAFFENNIDSAFSIQSAPLGMDLNYLELADDHPLKKLIVLLMKEFGITSLPEKKLRIESAIPIASGLGSGAACSVAVIRAFAEEYQKSISTQRISEIAFEIEKIYHGTPSGLDNTVISFGVPIYFIKNQPFQFIQIKKPLNLLIVDTEIESNTAEVVKDIRNHYETFSPLIHEIGDISRTAKTALEDGDIKLIGELMNKNHDLLKRLTVSSPELDYLYEIAIEQGAIGAKLTGSGRGGNIIALVEEEDQLAYLRQALQNKGAKVLN
ncbi:MAG TPA: mevalonate kinase [Flexilinea sp.]|nr:mevalonate kinase [Flexilinea sp.]